jgi:hypothetical protein
MHAPLSQSGEAEQNVYVWYKLDTQKERGRSGAQHYRTYLE